MADIVPVKEDGLENKAYDTLEKEFQEVRKGHFLQWPTAHRGSSD